MLAHLPARYNYPCPGCFPLAGFEVTAIGRIWGDHRGPGKDGTVIVRVYEAAGEPSKNVLAQWSVPIGQVNEANLIEDTGAVVKTKRDSFSFDLKPFEIKTFKLVLSHSGRSDVIPAQ